VQGRKWLRGLALAGVLAALAGCDKPMPVGAFAGTSPAFDPVTFWTGHARSWGVVENRGGAPTAIITTDCTGVADGPDGLSMHQTLTQDGKTTSRDWHMRRVSPGHFVATANGMAGEANGEAAGRAFHWTWRWKTGGVAGTVLMSQWMYLLDDGSLLNRTTVSKLGVTVAEVSEVFRK
jgi:hypothetical protein